MDKIIFVVEPSIYNNDGYKTRVEMEVEILKTYFDCYLLMPSCDREVLFKHRFKGIFRYDYYERLPFFFSRNKIQQGLQKVINELGYVLVYCEAIPSAIATVSVCKKNHLKLILDCHGDLVSEIRMTKKNLMGKAYAKLISILQQEVIEYSSLIVTVTKEQYRLFETNKDNVVLPMIPGKSFLVSENFRNEIRKSLNIPQDSVVFCYAGGNQKWQMAYETLAYYGKIEKKQANTFMLVYTREVKSFEKLAMDLKIKNIKILSVNYDEMPRYLDACDYGFCLRQGNMVNRVASPTKVMEYLSRNVMPILTEYVGDFSVDLKKQKLAIVLDDLDNVSLDYSRPEIQTGYNIEEITEIYRQQYVEAIKNMDV